VWDVPTYRPSPAQIITTRLAFNVSVHAGVYEPLSDTVLVWCVIARAPSLWSDSARRGASLLQQRHAVTGDVIATLDVRAYRKRGCAAGACADGPGAVGGNKLDQGATDGKGLLLIAANNGRLFWFDLRSRQYVWARLALCAAVC
jgi:hypothetical protein